MIRLLRVGQWWEPKLAPALTAAYATALYAGIPLTAALPQLGLLLLAMICGAACVSLVNDLTDRADDALCNKPNRLAGRSNAAIAALLALPVTGGALVAWLWRDQPALLLAYGGAWLAFALYSLPPVRAKQRGGWGVCADAAGAHMFPALMAALCLLPADGAPPMGWLVPLAIWAVAYGVRGIVWHQLIDRDNDLTAQVSSLVVRHPPERIRWLARWLIFPLECTALVIILWHLNLPVAWGALGLYAAILIGKIIYFQMRPTIVDSPPRYFILLQDFCVVLWPLALLIGAYRADASALLPLMLHALLFSRAIGLLAFDVGRIVIRCVRGHRYRRGERPPHLFE